MAKIGRSHGKTSVWKLVANWKKSAEVKMTASTANSSIMDVILSYRYCQTAWVSLGMVCPLSWCSVVVQAQLANQRAPGGAIACRPFRHGLG
ncbi:hypothetical protein G6F57_022437 [Rhizopus arrhizus]|nr:hypothetical protein G6F40_017131 [Rhizopus arrhizus]KAG1433078.1 hypothetical protein G6F57_022437 [Rhizopus arrhizus]